tara:strand:- start:1456 stop:1965 length:510 start_codon:yes stop_codon:yes gene_type:complete
MEAIGAEKEGNSLLKEEAIEYFVAFVQMLGLPKSVGQIYGVLFVSTEPLSMDDVILSLGISKGSASQGLSFLKTLGAVTSCSLPGERRERYEADLKVTRIVNHFYENRLQPMFENGEQSISRMLALAESEAIDSQARDSDVVIRIRALQKWQKRGVSVLPMILKWLKRW